jgi:hypothetical protein
MPARACVEAGVSREIVRSGARRATATCRERRSNYSALEAEPAARRMDDK